LSGFESLDQETATHAGRPLTIPRSRHGGLQRRVTGSSDLGWSTIIPMSIRYSRLNN
jgi:hypothetical protein